MRCVPPDARERHHDGWPMQRVKKYWIMFHVYFFPEADYFWYNGVKSNKTLPFTRLNKVVLNKIRILPNCKKTPHKPRRCLFISVSGFSVFFGMRSSPQYKDNESLCKGKQVDFCIIYGFREYLFKPCEHLCNRLLWLSVKHNVSNISGQKQAFYNVAKHLWCIVNLRYIAFNNELWGVTDDYN